MHNPDIFHWSLTSSIFPDIFCTCALFNPFPTHSPTGTHREHYCCDCLLGKTGTKSGSVQIDRGYNHISSLGPEILVQRPFDADPSFRCSSRGPSVPTVCGVASPARPHAIEKPGLERLRAGLGSYHPLELLITWSFCIYSPHVPTVVKRIIYSICIPIACNMNP